MVKVGLLDVLFPKLCAGCGRDGTYFCQHCIDNSQLFKPQICPVCKKPSLGGLTHKVCRSKNSPDGLTVVWKYSGAPEALVKKLKYKFVKQAAKTFGMAAANILKNSDIHKLPKQYCQPDTIFVPMPLYWQRENWRGFNHSEEIGRFLADGFGWRCRLVLKRTRNTQPQASLRSKQRKENVKGAFEIKEKPEQTNHIILFDDVWTTGATMLEAAKTLKFAGVQSIWCLALCG